jgi:cystathionine beta-lyase
MAHNFDELIDRRSSGCFKWNEYDEDVLPMFVADMDFRAPDPIIEALRRRVDHGVFGYEWTQDDLAQLVCERMKRLYDWSIEPADVVFITGVVPGLNLVCRAIGGVGDAALTHTPIYPPFMTAPINQGMTSDTAELKLVLDSEIIRYEIDFEAFNAAITQKTKLFNLCHPQNPTGRAFTSEELRQLGQICIEHNLVICSDEIHCDLLMGETKHIPFACISPEIADRCITLMAPSKSFNISGLEPSYAIVQNAELRKRLKKAMAGIAPEMNIMAITAFKVAYQSCEQWLEELRLYLTENRDIYVDYVIKNFPGIKTTVPEATYLAWLDCRNAGIEGSAYEFFLKNARVAMNDGRTFGKGGEGFLRFNFACPRSQMMRALEQMKTALAQVKLSPSSKLR